LLVATSHALHKLFCTLMHVQRPEWHLAHTNPAPTVAIVNFWQTWPKPE